MIGERVRPRVIVPGAQLRDLAGCAGDGILLTLGTGLGVVHRAQPFGNALAFFESCSRNVELGLSHESVGQVVESREGFSGTVAVELLLALGSRNGESETGCG